MTKEIWKDVKGYEGFYQITESGKIRSLDRVVPDGRGFEKEINGKELKTINDGKGIQLSKNSISKYYLINDLIKEHFNTKNKPVAYRLTSKDIVKIKKMYLDNKLTIKEIANKFGVTSGAIDYHAKKLGLTNTVRIKNKKFLKKRGKKLNKDEVIEIKKILKKGMKTQKEIAKMYGVCFSNISMIKRGVIWSDIKIDYEESKPKPKLEKEIKYNEDNFIQKFIKRILNIKY